jgi:hypothetical protein
MTSKESLADVQSFLPVIKLPHAIFAHLLWQIAAGTILAAARKANRDLADSGVPWLGLFA